MGLYTLSADLKSCWKDLVHCVSNISQNHQVLDTDNKELSQHFLSEVCIIEFHESDVGTQCALTDVIQQDTWGVNTVFQVFCQLGHTVLMLFWNKSIHWGYVAPCVGKRDGISGDTSYCSAHAQKAINSSVLHKHRCSSIEDLGLRYPEV